MIISEYKEPYNIVSFSPDEKDLKDRLQEWINNITFTDKRAKNYSSNEFNLEEQICLSYVLLDNNIIGFSSLFHRESHFGNSARCLNRLYYEKSSRKIIKLGRKYRPIIPTMVSQQFSFLDTNKFDMIFISREVGYTRFMQMTANILNDHSDLVWKTNDKLYPVCNENRSYCWQNLVYAILNNRKVELLSKGISKDEYGKRFEKN